MGHPLATALADLVDRFVDTKTAMCPDHPRAGSVKLAGRRKRVSFWFCRECRRNLGKAVLNGKKGSPFAVRVAHVPVLLGQRARSIPEDAFVYKRSEESIRTAEFWRERDPSRSDRFWQGKMI